VQLTATGYAFGVNGFIACPCRVTLSIRQVGTANSSYGQPNTLDSTTVGISGVEDLFADTWVFPVAAGQHAFAARMVLTNGSGTLLANAALTATFIPFGATGATP
jgi:hypothetical protein